MIKKYVEGVTGVPGSVITCSCNILDKILTGLGYNPEHVHAWIERECRLGTRTPWKIERLLRNTGPDPLRNHKLAQPAFNVGPMTAHF